MKKELFGDRKYSKNYALIWHERYLETRIWVGAGSGKTSATFERRPTACILMHLLEVDLLSDDLAVTAAFYETVLGLPVVHRDECSVAFGAGASLLRFRRSEKQRPVYHFAFNVPYQRVGEAHRWLVSQKEARLITPPGQLEDFSNWNAKAFYFYDNNGNVLEFIGRADLEHPGEEAVSVPWVQCVSEVGLVVDDVPQQAGALMERYGVPVFARQPRLPQFTALGDDNGLFILSGKERNWYPTPVPARPFWTRVVFEEKGVRMVLVHSV